MTNLATGPFELSMEPLPLIHIEAPELKFLVSL